MMVDETTQILNQVINYLKDIYDIDKNYRAYGTRCKIGKVIKFQNNVFISHWACGAIVCIDEVLYFIMEDDGNWYVKKDYSLGSFSSYWLDSFIKALNLLNDYIKKKKKKKEITWIQSSQYFL